MLYLLDNNHKHIYFHTHWSQSNARLLLTALGPPCKRGASAPPFPSFAPLQPFPVLASGLGPTPLPLPWGSLPLLAYGLGPTPLPWQARASVPPFPPFAPLQPFPVGTSAQDGELPWGTSAQAQPTGAESW